MPESNHNLTRSARRRRRITRLAAAAGMVILALLIAATGRTRSGPKTKWNTEPVIRGRFLKAVPGKGEVQTYQPAIVYNDCRNYEREILELVPEGTWVEEGDLICILDCSELQDQLKKQQTELIKAKAALANAEAQRELQNFHNARRTAAGEFQLTVAESKLRSFHEAESPLELEHLTGDIWLKQQQSQQSGDLYEQARLYSALGYRNTASLASARAAFEGTMRRRETAKNLLFLTKEYGQPRTRLELNAGADLARRDVDRIELQCDLTNAVTSVSVLECQKWVAGTQGYVDYLTGAIDACTMYAPRAGELAYCHRRDDGRYIEVGRKVHYMQNLIRIADRSQLTVAGRVSDRQAHAVHEEQPVLITVPTLPDAVFNGVLNWIAPIPSEGAWYLPNDMHHKLQVLLTDEAEVLEAVSLGASARLDIIVDDRPDIVQVSTDAVVPFFGEYAVVVAEGESLYVQLVILGVSNDEVVEIRSGLSGDEQVVVDTRHKLRELAETLSLTVRQPAASVRPELYTLSQP